MSPTPFDLMIDEIRKVVREEIAAAAKIESKPKLTYTTAEAAAVMNVPESWLATAARDGRVPCVKIGHYVRFRLSDLENFIDRKNGSENAA